MPSIHQSKSEYVCQASEPVYLPQPLPPGHQLHSLEKCIHPTSGTSVPPRLHHSLGILRAMHPALLYQKYNRLSCPQKPLEVVQISQVTHIRES
ncbi:hypothetical protein [Methanothrix sp.]|uniref:hypothetical protein n=1 Tax=Methanothrix sp. TaxID=90426 RepID=UPI003BB57C9C